MKKNTNLAINIIAIAIGMLMLAYASVPLYKVFCQATGFGGTIQISYAKSEKVGTRKIRVYFDANVDPKLRWHFKNKERYVDTIAGENAITFYEAENLTDKPIKAIAAYNVTPLKAGKYFNKIRCFCFEEQILQPHQKVEFPVTFFIDADIENNIYMEDVEEITLSYTFFEVEEFNKQLPNIMKKLSE